EAKTSHAVAANLSELKLKKILIDKMEANKSISRSDIQRQLCKALVDTYEADKILLDTYGDTVTIKRPRDGADDAQEPFVGIDRGSKRRRSGKEPESTSALREKTTTTAGKTTIERLAFNVSLRMFTRSVVIQRRVEDLQLGVESYQKKLNLTKPDTYKSNLRRRDSYTPYSDPRGFIYENKDTKNRLMRIDELHKFSNGTLDDVRTALNDRLKGIRMEYLPQTFWSQRDKVNARAMIQAIDKRLKTRRIMRNLERFVGGRPYGGDLRLLQRTI
ncbi:hypothetical protein Tco_1021478, partial [Tanacetum coccineum]